MWMTIGLAFEYGPLLDFVPVLEILFFLLGARALLGNWYHCHGSYAGAQALATQVLGLWEVLEKAGLPTLFSVIGEEQSGL